jgi:hypothetical protein
VIFSILATGPSMSQAVADRARVLGSVLAVNDAFELAPWAYGLVANDMAWWRQRPHALAFAGRKFSASNVPGVERVPNQDTLICRGSNSGVVAMFVARMLGAKRILLFGFDFHGTHYFGDYKPPLRNSTTSRFPVFGVQFQRMADLLQGAGIEVFNCTPGSKLKVFPMMEVA